MTLILQIDWAYSMLLPLAVGCIKCSILFFYMRIFTVDKRGAVNLVLATLIVLVALMSVAFCIATMFECRLDFWAIWGPTKYVLAHCVEPMDIVLGLCIADFVSDVAIICAPIPLVSDHLALFRLKRYLRVARSGACVYRPRKDLQLRQRFFLAQGIYFRSTLLQEALDVNLSLGQL